MAATSPNGSSSAPVCAVAADVSMLLLGLSWWSRIARPVRESVASGAEVAATLVDLECGDLGVDVLTLDHAHVHQDRAPVRSWTSGAIRAETS